jgi:hypothetical protein
MGAIVHKMCERAEQELWDILKEPVWSKEHAEIAFYLTEIMKGAKKIEHLRKLEETMEKYEDEDREERIQKGQPRYYERNMREYSMYEEDEDAREDYARRMGRYTRGKSYNYEHHSPAHHNPPEREASPPIVYNLGGSSPSYYEEKYRELLEDKWEKEKKEKEQQAMAQGKMPLPAK